MGDKILKQGSGPVSDILGIVGAMFGVLLLQSPSIGLSTNWLV